MPKDSALSAAIELLKQQASYCAQEASNLEARALDHERRATEARSQCARYRIEHGSHILALARLTGSEPA